MQNYKKLSDLVAKVGPITGANAHLYFKSDINPNYKIQNSRKLLRSSNNRRKDIQRLLKILE